MSLESIFKLSVIVNMIDHLTTPMSRINVGVNQTTTKLDSLGASFGGIAKAGVVMAGTGQQIAGALMKPIQATFDTKEALGQLSALGIQDLNALSTAATDFSSKWAGTSKADFLNAAYDIKSGIASLSDEGVAQYTEMAGLTAKATKSSTGEMTSLFATGYGIYKDFYSDLSDMEFGEMFSGGIAQSVKIFKTSGSGMAQSIESLGASATTAMVPMEEQLAVLGTLQATMSGSEAGTKYRAFLQTAAKAGDALGLSFVDANNQMRSLPEILGTLRTKYGDTLDAIEKQDIKKAFGSDEAVALIDQFYNKNDQLQESILNLNGTMGQGTAVTLEMANAINSTEPNRWQIISQRVQNLKEQVGNGLLPQFNRFMDMAAGGIDKLSAWIGENQELVNTILTIVGVFGIVLSVGGAALGTFGMIGLIGSKSLSGILKFAGLFKDMKGKVETIRIVAMYAGDGLKAGFGMARTAAITLGGGIGRAAAALPGLIGSVWGFTTALLANPITWVVAGIIVLIAVVILLWRNWDSVTAFISGAWNGFVDGIVAGFDWVRNLFAGMPMWLQIALAVFLPFIGIPMLIINHWGEITGFFSGLWGNVQSIFSGGIDTVKGVIDGAADWFFNSGSKIMTTFTNGIKSAISAPVDAVKGGLQKIRNMLPFSDAKVGPLSSLTLSGRRVLETLTTGIGQSEDLPAQAVDKSFGKVDLSAGKAGKVNLREVFRSEESSTSETTTQSDGIYINEFKMLIDPTKIRSLADLERLMQWMMDYIKSHGGTPTPAEG